MIPPKNSMIAVRVLVTFVVCLLAAAASAQTVPGATPAQQRNLLELLSAGQWKLERVSENHWRLTGDVEWEPPGTGLKFTADEIEIFTDTNKLQARGNVVFTNPEGRIAAERVEFDMATGVGTFHQASGIMTLGPTADRAQFGNQDPDVYFYGDTIEKVSNRQYRISRGGFSTCVQPTPRWEVVSKSVTINLDEYAIARNMVLRVKGVPLMYLPILYYPIQDDERATGFLMPTYGSSTVRGQALSNAFFWAINRSQDATLYHDWYSRAGQGIGGEYRYQSNLASYGNLRVYRMAQKEAVYTQGSSVTRIPQSTSYRVDGGATQTMFGTLRARGRIDYFTDIVTQQLHQQNVSYLTQPYRIIEGGLNAGAGRVSSSFQYQRSELFSNPDSRGRTQSQVYGSTPRATLSVAPSMLFGAPIYASMNADYAFLPNRSLTDGEITLDRSVGRMDLAPALRVPLSRLTYLAVNTSAAYRTTYFSRSRVPNSDRLMSEDLIRQFLSVRTDITGPVLTKIWDTPDSLATERMKHVIEPTFSVDYVTEMENQALVPITSDVTDSVVGGAARFTYGLYNRLFYRGRTLDGSRGTTREFVTIGLQQTYYTDPRSSLVDTTYSSRRPLPVDLSPFALTTRVSPSAAIDGTVRVEYDVSGIGMQLLSATGTAQLFAAAPVGGVSPASVNANVSFSRTRSSATAETDRYLTLSSTSRWMSNRVGANYALSWDIARAYIVSQSIMASYMAQCCGVQADFQVINRPSGSPYPSDRRFNFAFVLAGLGTFSNFFGAFAQR
jgi:LPS-assembly protein